MSRQNQKSDTESDNQLKLAVLIDADNAQAAVIKELLEEISGYGEATVKRIYGDFTSPHAASWRGVLQQHAIKPVQQFAYSTGKNSTDSTLIIDAMDLLYTRKFDGFCLITSDSDFTGLAMRLREEGLQVFGFGEKKTPLAFRNACHKFVLTEVLRSWEQQPAAATYGQPVPEKGEKAAKPPVPIAFLLSSLEQVADDNGWAMLTQVGQYMTKIQPDFDARRYGFHKLSELFVSMPQLFEVVWRPSDAKPDGGNVTYVKARARGRDLPCIPATMEVE